TSFLWAESATAGAAGSYAGHFEYSNAIGWQSAIVGLRPWNHTTAFDGSATTFQNAPVGVTLSATSPNGLPLTYTIVTTPAHGTASGTAPTLTYTPAANYVGPDAFTFKANDGITESNVATISITVRLPNRPPTANNSTTTATTSTASAVGMSANDPD